MYKGFCEDVEYVMGLFFKPFEKCCGEADDRDEEEERDRGMGCDFAPCMKRDKDEDEQDKEAEEKDSPGLLSEGPLQDIMKCLFDASDIDYDYED